MLRKKRRKNKRIQIFKYWDYCKSVSEENMRCRSIDINMARVGKCLEYIIKSKDNGDKKQSFWLRQDDSLREHWSKSTTIT